MISGLPVFDVDFNSILEDDTLIVCRDFSFNVGSHGLRRGAAIQLWDAEGGSCVARVERARGRRLEVMVDWDTWEAATTIEPALVWDHPIAQAILTGVTTESAAGPLSPVEFVRP